MASQRDSIPKISKKEFDQRLSRRKFENLASIKVVERWLKKKRGYVFKMPKPGSSVILLASGGLDSTVTWYVLMQMYKLRVYPLLISPDSLPDKNAQRAMKFFTQEYKSEFPDLFIEPQQFSTVLPPREIRKMLNRPANFAPGFILKSLELTEKRAEVPFMAMTAALLPFLGAIYSLYLKSCKQLKVETVLTAVTANDGLGNPNQSYTALRGATLAVCMATANYSWNIASFLFERELGHWMVKAEVIKLGKKFNIPLERTWSCYAGSKLHCGECLGCRNRKYEFAKAKVKDNTVYQGKSWLQRKVEKNVARLGYHLRQIQRD